VSDYKFVLYVLYKTDIFKSAPN